MPEEFLNTARLRKVTDEMVVAMTSPQFVEAMRVLKSTPREKRLEIGAKLLNPAALRAAGAPIPAHIRVSSRYFETGFPTIEVIESAMPGQPPTASTVPDSGDSPFFAGSSPIHYLGGGCCCGGAAGACGGCGGGELRD